MNGKNINLFKRRYETFEFGFVVVILGLIFICVGLMLHSSMLYHFIALIIVFFGILLLCFDECPGKRELYLFNNN